MIISAFSPRLHVSRFLTPLTMLVFQHANEFCQHSDKWARRRVSALKDTQQYLSVVAERKMLLAFSP